MSDMTIHASCVAIDGTGILIEGRSGAGKTDLALRLIDRGAVLVSDDYTDLTAAAGRLVATPPAKLAGRIEVRGIGIVAMTHAASADIALIVAIDPAPPRLPDPPLQRMLAGIAIAEIALPALEPSAPIKVELALRQVLAT